MAFETMELVGGRPVLDFTNTTSGRRTPAPHERLHAYSDLVEWCVGVGLVDPAEAARLLAEAGRRPEAARAALERALALREAIYGIFVAETSGEAPDPAHLETLNAALAEGMARRRLCPSPGAKGCCWTWAGAADDLAWMLWPLAHAAAELLTSGELERVKACGGETCDWLFLDASKNRSRRWCDMRYCGNQAKARRHYRRSRES
jgi:predicted RNA-binding Zn ribbon-like protein